MMYDEIPARLDAPLEKASIAYEAAYGTPGEAAALARLRAAEAAVARDHELRPTPRDERADV